MGAETDAATGATLWLTGVPASGKSSIARALSDHFQSARGRVEVLDGDEVRARISPRLGLSRDDREEHMRRLGFIASLLARNGVLAVVPAIAPFADVRDEIRADHRARGIRYFEVHVHASLEECARRDPKGLYRAQREGRLRELTGVDAPYDVPAAPDLRVDTERQSISEIVREIDAMLPSEATSPRPPD